MDWNDLIGSDLGPYHILSELGRGGTSRVYRSFDADKQRDVAIKVIANSAEDRVGFVRRFEREVRAIAQLNHPNIVSVFDRGETDEFVYLVMQCISGGTLRSALGRPLPVGQAATNIIQMAQALHHAHQHGIIHRDVKPSNMLIDSDNPRYLLLTDFGIAKLQGMRGLTKTGTTIGTPEYMAPEQAEGKEIDPRADVYSLGCVLYESLAGRPPFTGSTNVSVLYQQVHTRPAYIRGFNSEVPRELMRVLEQALAKNPEERFSTAEALALALLPFADEALPSFVPRDAHDAPGTQPLVLPVSNLLPVLPVPAPAPDNWRELPVPLTPLATAAEATNSAAPTESPALPASASDASFGHNSGTLSATSDALQSDALQSDALQSDALQSGALHAEPLTDVAAPSSEPPPFTTLKRTDQLLPPVSWGGLGTEGLDAIFPDDPEAQVARAANNSGPISPRIPVNSRPNEADTFGGRVARNSGPIGGPPTRGGSTIPLPAFRLPSKRTQPLNLPLTPDGRLDMEALMTQVEEQGYQSPSLAPPPFVSRYESTPTNNLPPTHNLRGPSSRPSLDELPPTHNLRGPNSRPSLDELPPTYNLRGPNSRPSTADLPPTHSLRGPNSRPSTADLPPTHNLRGPNSYPAGGPPSNPAAWRYGWEADEQGNAMPLPPPEVPYSWSPTETWSPAQSWSPQRSGELPPDQWHAYNGGNAGIYNSLGPDSRPRTATNSMPLHRALQETGRPVMSADQAAYTVWRPTPEPSGERPVVRAIHLPKLRRLPPRGPLLLATAVAAVLLVSLIIWVGLSATGLLTRAHGSTATPPRATVVATATTAPTVAVPTATVVPAPTTNPQAQLDSQAAAAFSGINVAQYNDSTCGAANGTSHFATGQTVYVNLCLAPNAQSGPVSVYIRQNGQIVFTLTEGTYVSPNSHYWYSRYGVAAGTYDALVTYRVNGQNAVARDIAFTVG